jgi:hypothetical protein
MDKKHPHANIPATLYNRKTLIEGEVLSSVVTLLAIPKVLVLL